MSNFDEICSAIKPPGNDSSLKVGVETGSSFPGNYLTPTKLADMLGVSERTLGRWHAMRIGPPRISIGKLIFYCRTECEKWLVENELRPVRRSPDNRSNEKDPLTHRFPTPAKERIT